MSAVLDADAARMRAALERIMSMAEWACLRGGKDDAAAVIEDIRNEARAVLSVPV